jgi:hypothetical protein
MKKTIRLTEADLTRLVKKVIEEQVKPTNQNEWSKYPCVAKLKDSISPKGEKSKRGEDIFKDILFYSNGRCMDVTNKSKSFYKCHPTGAIVVSDDPNINLDTIDVGEY